jgi:flagellar basal-body rod protein FlgF
MSKENALDSGLYAACAGLVARTDSLDSIANNLANVSTAGFRGNLGSFQSVMAAASQHAPGSVLNEATNSYGVLGATRLDPSEGSLTATGNPLDFAIQGPGYFAVQTPSGEKYTRNGAFRVSAQGQLVTQTGESVLGSSGPVQLVPGQTSVSKDGTISTNGTIVGKLKVVEFAAGTNVQSAGAGYYSVPSNSVQTAKQSTVNQAMLESSNVNPVASVVELIEAQRSAETMRHALTMFDSDLDKTAAQDLPRVTNS